ncbi:MAG TPA: SRPBCC family protein [Anaerolineales bacterium]
MIKVEHSVVIDRPVPEVFAFVTNPANNAKWQDGLVESRMASSEPMGEGARVVDVRKFLGRDMESNLEVTIFEPNKRYVQKVVSGPIPFEIIQTFDPSVNGTKLTILAQGEPGGFFKLAEGLVRKQLESQIQGDAERLKKILEVQTAE